MTKSGFVSVVGRPNAGKSSLLNHVLGEKIAMVSHKAQATRKRLNFIVMHKNAQIIFVDTPGIHEKEKLLNQFMLEEALKAIGDCDLILFLAPASDDLRDYKNFLTLNTKKQPHIVLLTKTDTVSNEALLSKIAEFQEYQEEFLELIPISITKEMGIDSLLDSTVKYLPESPYLYEEEYITTQSVKDIYKELIRESLFHNLSDELPYESDVLITKIEESPRFDKIYATIVVEKSTQKGMIVGKKGETIKRIGKMAREGIVEFSGKKIYLDLHVSHKKGWSKSKEGLEDLGYKF